MKILVINSDCIQTNSSANLCHLAYIRGIVDLGHDVTLLSADGCDYVLDPSMTIPPEVNQHTYYGVSLYEKLSLKKGENATAVPISSSTAENGGNSVKQRIKANLIKQVKTQIRSLYGVHGLYSTFARKAVAFRSDDDYDYIISISTPASSHLLAYNLLKKKHIKGKHWIQIWEDPWFSDVYGFTDKDKIYNEEKRLLSFAEKICYVSPLTLENQKKLFPESAEKMYWQPLPYYYKGEQKRGLYPINHYGYFGDYAPSARNLLPFYTASVNSGIEVDICGRPDNLFASTETVHIHPRLPLSELKIIEDTTNVLVFLCNRKGGQIPGKIYQYSATNKIILFILDGTDEEKLVLKSFFEKFNRFIFCNNTVEDIEKAISQIEKGEFGAVKNEPLEAFNPEITIKKILEMN